MPDFPKFSDLHRIARDEAVSRSRRLTVNAVDRDGTDANIMTAAGAVVGEEVIGQLADVEEGFWLDSARGPKLDKWAADRYGMSRKPAAPAFVHLLFTPADPAAPPETEFTIPAGTRAATSDGREFITLVNTTWPAFAAGPITVLARSVLAGLDQAIGGGAIKSVTTAIPFAPIAVLVQNAEASSGAANVESDDDFKARIRRFWSSLRRGTKAAIEFGALSVPGVVKAIAIEGLQSNGYPTRSVSLVISDSFTNALVLQASGAQRVQLPAYDTQSQAFAVVVANALDEYRAYGVPVTVSVAQVRMIQVVLRLRFSASVSDTNALALYARTLVVQHINELRPGATFDPAAIVALLRSVAGLEIFGDEVASPIGPIIPTSLYQVLRASLANITFESQATLQSEALV